MIDQIYQFSNEPKKLFFPYNNDNCETFTTLTDFPSGVAKHPEMLCF
jgi:hypothetical protein